MLSPLLGIGRRNGIQSMSKRKVHAFLPNYGVPANHHPHPDRCHDLPRASWSWLKNCTSLKTLTIEGMQIKYVRSATAIYGHLKNLSIVGPCSAKSWNGLKCIVKECKNLKSIELDTCVVFTPQIFDWIAIVTNHLSCLNHLRRIAARENWSFFREHMTAFLQLKKLNYLSIYFGYWDYYSMGWLFQSSLH